MPTKPEPSPTSGNISPSSPPIHQNGKPTVETFDKDELLYRRYRSEHFINGKILPASFSFPKQSFNRSRFSKPEDVLHVDCCDGKPLSPKDGWGVIECNVSALPSPVESTDGRSFRFFAKHVPLPTCYAHSELWCTQNPSDVYTEPPSSVKEAFRIRLARILKPRIFAV